jgi:hypothetical protein
MFSTESGEEREKRNGIHCGAFIGQTPAVLMIHELSYVAPVNSELAPLDPDLQDNLAIGTYNPNDRAICMIHDNGDRVARSCDFIRHFAVLVSVPLSIITNLPIMAVVDKLLSLDMGTDDCFYRLRRDFGSTSSVIYVHLRNLDIVAEDCQTYGPDLIKELRSKVKDWDGPWTTLTVFREDGKVQSAEDQWKPHSLPLSAISRELPRLNVLDLAIIERLKNPVSRVRLRDQRRILKICPFEYELPYFAREVKAYDALYERGCVLVPCLSGYVFERS